MFEVPKADYKDYLKDSGLATSQWGPPAWVFLFASIHGAYPPKIDPKNKDHVQIQKSFKQMLHGLQFTMPCIFCRNSYKDFIKQLPIEPFLKGRIELMFWLYTIRDKVNKKLITQEREAFNKLKKALKLEYHQGGVSKEEYYKMVEDGRKKHQITKESPSFVSVLQRYEKTRSKCSKETKTCAL
jgi:hypothetical protein